MTGQPITFEEYVALSPDDPNVASAIKMLSKSEEKSHLFVVAYKARRDAWGAEDAEVWLRDALNERQVNHVLKRVEAAEWRASS